MMQSGIAMANGAFGGRPPAGDSPAGGVSAHAGAPAAAAADPRLQEWVELARGGCRQSFGCLVEMFLPRILNYLLQMTGSRHDAQDLAQDTFVKAFRSMPRFERPQAFPAWLFTIARHTALNHFRGRRATVEVDPEWPADAADPGRATAARDEWQALWQTARKLKPAQFEVLWLHYGEEMPVHEIAQVTRRTSVHVRVLLHRGRQKLLQLLGEQGDTFARPGNTLCDSAPSGERL